MAMNLHNNGNSLDKMLDDADSKRLRGQRLTKIKQDLSDRDMDQKEKVLAYSDHLSWCMKIFENIYRLQQMTADAHAKSTYAHGMANGVIGAMAVIMEEQGDVPYIPAPAKYKKSDEQFASDVVRDYVMTLEQHVGKMLLMDESGPEGYQDEDNPIFAWILDFIDIMKRSPVDSDELNNHRSDLYNAMKQRTTQKQQD